MTRLEIDNALEEVIGSERWREIKKSAAVTKLIESSASVYEAAERINQLLQSDLKNHTTG